VELSDLAGGPALQALIDHGVPFVVVGGLAVAANGYRRPTKDIDVLIADSTDSKARVVAALASRGGVIDRTGDPVASVDWTDDRALIVRVAGIRVDVLPEGVGPLSFREARGRARVVEVCGVDVPVIDLATLVAFKRLAGRPQDRDDLAALKRIHGPLPIIPVPGLDPPPAG
jgi:predicted nucleotidyltransferase